MADLNFSQVHPEYTRWRDRWAMSWDFYRGGLHVLKPDYEQTLLFYASSDVGDNATGSGGPDTDGARPQKRFSWAPKRYNGYLHTHERESINRYEDRCTRAMHIPVVRPIVDALVSGVLRSEPPRDGAGAFPWNAYLDDVDNCGTSIDAFARKALTMAVLQGRVLAMTDKPSVDTPAPSLGHQLARGERPYAYLVSALDLLDWRLDEFGRPVWLVIREDMPDTRGPGESQSAYGKNQYRVWMPYRWELWQPQSEGADYAHLPAYIQVDDGTHPFDRPPGRFLFARRAQDNPLSLESDSLVTDLVDADRAVYNLVSLLHELEYSQTFSQMVIPGEAGDFGPVEMGPWNAFVYPGEGGAGPSFISPNPSTPQGLWDRITSMLFAVRNSAGMSRGMAEASKEGRSAAAISFESEEKYVQMSALAEQVDEWESGLYEDLATWAGLDDTPRVRRPRRFDLRSVSQQIADQVQMMQLALGPRPMAAMAKPVVARILREQGIDDNGIEGVLKEIDLNAEKPEPEPKLVEGPPPSPEFSESRRTDLPNADIPEKG